MSDHNSKAIQDPDLQGLFQHLMKLKEDNQSQVEEIERVASRFDRLAASKNVSIPDDLLRNCGSMNDLSFSFDTCGGSDEVSSMSSGSGKRKSKTRSKYFGKSGRMFKSKPQQRRSSLPEQNTTLLQFLEEQESKRNSAEQLCQYYQAQAETLHEENESLQNQLQDHKSEKDALHNQLGASGSLSTDLSELVDTQAKEMQKIFATCEKQKATIDDLRKENKKLIRQRRLSLQEQQTNLDEAKQAITSLKSERRLSLQSQQISSLKRDRKSLRVSWKEIEKKKPPPLLEKETMELLEDFRLKDEEVVEVAVTVTTEEDAAREEVVSICHSGEKSEEADASAGKAGKEVQPKCTKATNGVVKDNMKPDPVQCKKPSIEKSEESVVKVGKEVEPKQAKATKRSVKVKRKSGLVNSKRRSSKKSDEADASAVKVDKEVEPKPATKGVVEDNKKPDPDTNVDPNDDDVVDDAKAYSLKTGIDPTPRKARPSNMEELAVLKARCEEQEHQLESLVMEKTKVEEALRSAEEDTFDLCQKLEEHWQSTEIMLANKARESDEKERAIAKKLEEAKQEYQIGLEEAARKKTECEKLSEESQSTIAELRQQLETHMEEAEKAIEAANFRKDELDLMLLQNRSKRTDSDEKKEEHPDVLVQELRSELAEQSSKVNHLKSLCRQKTTAMESLEKKNAALFDRVKAEEEAQLELRDTNKDLQQKFQAAELEIETLMALVDEKATTLRENLESTKNALERRSEENVRIKEELKSNQDELASVRVSLSATIAANADLIKVQQNEIASSKLDYEALSKELENTREHSNQLKEKVQRQKREVTNFKPTNDTLLKELDGVRQAAKEVQDTKKQCEGTLQSISSTIQSLESALENQKTEQTSLEEKKAQISSELEAAKETILHQSTELGSLKHSNESLSQELALAKDATNALEGAKGIIKSNSETIQTLAQSLEKEKEEKESLMGAKDALSSELAATKYALRQMESSGEAASALKVSKKELEDTVESLQQAVQMERQEKETLQKDTRRLRSELEAAAHKLEQSVKAMKDSSDKIQSNSAIVKSLEEENESLKQDVARISMELNAATGKLQEKEDIIQSNSAALQSLKEAQASLQQEKEILSKSLQAANDKTQQLAVHLEEFQKSVDNARLSSKAEIQRLEEALEEHKVLVGTLEEENNVLGNSLESANVKLEKQETEMKSLKQNCEKFSLELAAARDAQTHAKDSKKDSCDVIHELQEALKLQKTIQESLKQDKVELSKQLDEARDTAEFTEMKEQYPLLSLTNADPLEEGTKNKKRKSQYKLAKKLESQKAKSKSLKEEKAELFEEVGPLRISVVLLKQQKKWQGDTVNAKVSALKKNYEDTLESKVTELQQRELEIEALKEDNDLLSKQLAAAGRAMEKQYEVHQTQRESTTFHGNAILAELQAAIKAKKESEDAHVLTVKRLQDTIDHHLAEIYSFKAQFKQVKEKLLSDTMHAQKSLMEQKEANQSLEKEQQAMVLLCENQKVEIESLRLKKDKLIEAVKFTKSALNLAQDSVEGEKALSEEQMKELRLNNKKLADYVSSLEASKKETILQCENLKVELETFKYKNEKLGQDLRLAQHTSHELSDQKKQATKALKKALETHNKTLGEFYVLENENKKLQRDLRTAEATASDLEERLAKQESVSLAQQTSHERHMEESNQKTQATKEIKTLQAWNESLSKDLREALKLVSTLKKALETHNKAIYEVAVLENENEKLQRDLRTAEATASDLQNRLAKQESVSVEKHIEKLATLTQQRSRDSAEIQAKTSSLRLLRERLQSQASSIEEYQNNEQKLEEQIRALQRQARESTVIGQAQSATILQYQTNQQSMEYRMSALRRERDSLSSGVEQRTASSGAHVNDIVNENRVAIESLASAIDEVVACQDHDVSTIYDDTNENEVSTIFEDTEEEGIKMVVTGIRSLGTGILNLDMTNDQSLLDSSNGTNDEAEEEPDFLNNIVDIVSLGSSWVNRGKEKTPVAKSRSLAKGVLPNLG